MNTIKYTPPKIRLHKTNKGLTLIEVLLVLAIIAILAMVFLTRLNSVRNSAFEARAQMEMQSFASALTQYVTNYGVYPPDEDRNIPAGLENYLSSKD